MKPMKFFLPALFLFTLGVGNIIVGNYKEWQYKQVYDELTELQPSPPLSSTLSRLQTAKQTSDRHLQRQFEANERRNLYRLVSFGGKSFIALSLLFFSLALFCQYRMGAQQH
jgi:hypothetical protein